MNKLRKMLTVAALATALSSISVLSVMGNSSGAFDYNTSSSDFYYPFLL